jgi:hypothetical protein
MSDFHDYDKWSVPGDTDQLDKWFVPEGDQGRVLSSMSPEERSARFPLVFPLEKTAMTSDEHKDIVKRWRNDLEDALFELGDGSAAGTERGIRILETLARDMDS